MVGYFNDLRLEEASPEKAGVGGSTPSLATIFSITYTPRVIQFCPKLVQKIHRWLVGVCLNLPRPSQNFLISPQISSLSIEWWLTYLQVLTAQALGQKDYGLRASTGWPTTSSALRPPKINCQLVMATGKTFPFLARWMYCSAVRGARSKSRAKPDGS
jgi:hypothetical protein